ncbi:glycoside hydrolase family 35 protein [Hyaloscypha variabilis F]|uniref:Beta-galactosidase n=1 Tax=Hyaloscypha variabilis (strain UAMH 11265 / GT02V1 / F) TaxID=1149755 RepID=A0A2J6S400_HYAVF|nr:glycoside hydrolase family 35 protein [Hyaloscypha variabilis F]
MLFLKSFVLVSVWLSWTLALRVGNDHSVLLKSYKRALLQELVTWDQHSIFIRGERLFLFSGEVHPFRIPSPGLWLDIFQKIKAMGFNGVSFYTYWGLLEGNQGNIVTEGIFSLDEFFRAASEAGIYLIARPGPYINAETAAGGIPGWVLRIKGTIRSTSPDYLNATENYIATIGSIIADAQITNGGPVILVQTENEYTSWPGVTDFPDAMNRDLMAFTEQRFRDAGIVVPFVFNDNVDEGYFAPGSGVGATDIYGIDSYPFRYACNTPYFWPTIRWPTTWQTNHTEWSPTTPFAILEFEGGAGDPWGGVGEDQCAILVNNDGVRVFYKNNYSFGPTIFNIYMIYGGTNWGNLGYMGGYTSYDYGASITEDRLIWREKYSEMKLQANFFKVSPAYLTATPGSVANGSYASTTAIAVTPLFGDGTRTNFYVVRHADFTSWNDTTYKLTVPTTIGNVTIPQLGGSLALYGRDAKIHVTDYDIGGINLIYSSGEIFTWTKSYLGLVAILYGGAGEIHELAMPDSLPMPSTPQGSSIKVVHKARAWVVQWQVTPERQILAVGNLSLYLCWRNEVYDYWTLELPAPAPISNYSSPSKSSVIVKAGYLLRSAIIIDKSLRLIGDVNATTEIEVIATPTEVTDIWYNGQLFKATNSSTGNLLASVDFTPPDIILPDFTTLDWKYIDSLPEVQSSYDDSNWTPLTHTATNNPWNITTPTSMYASDYGFHTGSLIYRGHFTSNSNESSFFVNITGGDGFGHSIWLDSTFLGSWFGNGSDQSALQTVSLPSLSPGTSHILTVLIDHMGQDEEAPGTDQIKHPRGITDYLLSGHAQSDINWKMTGNLGGEQYLDLARGPRNEGAMFAERMGYHLPNPPSQDWKTSNPISDGIQTAGVGFYTTTFELNVPVGWDIPMNFVFNSSTSQNLERTGGNHRVQFFVNGFQFGKYVNNLGPQTAFPVPEGILNYNGKNTVALTLWSLDASGARLKGFELVVSRVIKSGYTKPALVQAPAWTQRISAY